MSFQFEYDFDFGDLVERLRRALSYAMFEGDSDWVDVEADVFEFELDEDGGIPLDDLEHARRVDIPTTLLEALGELGLDCRMYRYTGEPGLKSEYVAACRHILSGDSYTVYFDVDIDYTAGLVRVIAVRAVRGARKPGADYV